MLKKQSLYQLQLLEELILDEVQNQLRAILNLFTIAKSVEKEMLQEITEFEIQTNESISIIKELYDAK